MDNQFEERYSQLNWVRWIYQSGNFKSLKKANPSIPPMHGVYLFRAPHKIPRVRGASDVIYIGQSGGGLRGGKQGIGPGNSSPGRLFNTRGPDEWVRQKIEELYPGESFIVECSFTDEEDPSQIEKELLLAYLDAYFELPPANHQSIKM